MKRKLALILTCTMVVSAALVGCGKEENSINESSSTNIEESTENKTSDITNELTTTEEDLSYDDMIAKVELCDYSSIPITTKFTEITEDDILNEMNYFISLYESYEHITDGVIENGMTVNIDYVGKLDGVEFDGGSATSFDLTIGSGQFIDGFETSLIGSEVGTTKTIECTFPEDYAEETLAGKLTTFDVTINYIRGDKIEPELTDEFVSQTGYESVEALRIAVTEYLETSNLSTYKVTKENEILEYLINNSKLPAISIARIEEYENNMTEYYTMYAEMFGMEFADFCETNLGVTEEEYKESCRESAINYVSSTIVLQAIANKENISISDDEFNSYVTELATANGYESVEELLSILDENNETEEMKQEALFNKVMKFMETKIVETE